MSECIAGSTYTFPIAVFDSASMPNAKENPTIELLDFAISINGTGAWETLDNLPAVSPAGYASILITLSAAETTAASGGFILFRVADNSGGGGWTGGYFEKRVRAYGTATSNDVTTITSALTTIDDFLDTEIAAIKARTDNLPTDPADASDIATSFTTLTNKLTAYVQLLARKDAGIATTNATELTAINTAGGTFSNQTDSVEALRDRGDAAWITATGFATSAALTTVDGNVTAIKAKTDNLPASPASTTNITAGTITTVTNLTNAPTNGDLTATMKASVTMAATAATPIAASVTGNVGGNVTGSVGSVVGAVGSVTGNVGGNVVGSVASVTAGVTLADNAITAAKIGTNAIDADALSADALAEIVAAVMGEVLESGKTVKQAILDMWAVQVGDAAANSATEPTSITYDSPDGTVQVTHTLTSTTRAVS